MTKMNNSFGKRHANKQLSVKAIKIDVNLIQKNGFDESLIDSNE